MKKTGSEQDIIETIKIFPFFFLLATASGKMNNLEAKIIF